MDPVRVLVVADDPLARAGLVALLSARDDLALAGEAGQADAARLAASLAPAVVLWDAGAAGEPSAALAELEAPAVALAAGEGQAADALRAGARAVLFRGARASTIAAALRAAAEGLTALDASLARDWLRPPEAASGGELTPREREVLALLAEGLANKAIAARLGISEHTAKFHVNAILAKLGAESRAAAIVRAARMGLVAL